MQQLPLALILIKFPNNCKGSSVNMKSQGLVKHCLQVWPQASDNPGMVSDLVMRQQTIESLVKVLKTDILSVHTFIVAYMQQHNGPTASLQVSLN